MLLQVIPNSSSELLVKWQPPQHANGNVTHYLIIGTVMKDNQQLLDQRNYCQEREFSSLWFLLNTQKIGMERENYIRENQNFNRKETFREA